MARPELILARATVNINGHIAQTGQVNAVIPVAKVGHNFAHAGIALVPTVKFDVHRATTAGKNNVLTTISRVEIFAQLRAATHVQMQCVALLCCKVGLHTWCVIFQIE